MVEHEQDLEDLKMRTAYSMESVDQIDDMVRTISRMTAKLKQHPDQNASAALVDALKEVTLTWEVINDAFKDVWQLYNVHGDLKKASEGLSEISDFQLLKKVKIGRGHCHKIGDIYDEQLAAWFKQALSDNDQQTMRHIFEYLGKSDLDAFYIMEMEAGEIEQTANRVLDLVENNQPDAARQVAGALRQNIRPLRT